MKLQLRNVSSLNLTRRHVFPTPESPITIIWCYCRLSMREDDRVNKIIYIYKASEIAASEHKRLVYFEI